MGRKRTIIPKDSGKLGFEHCAIKLPETLRSEITDFLNSKPITHSLDDAAWTRLEEIVQQYDVRKASSLTILDHQPVANKKKEIAARAQSLAAAFEMKRDSAGEPDPHEIQALQEIENEIRDRWPFDIRPIDKCGHYEWNIEDVITLIEQVAQAAETASRYTAQVAPKDFGFRGLCRDLAQWWRTVTGKKATIRKDDDKRKADHSPFILFVDMVLTALPEKIRPHFNSTSALSTAVSNELREKIGFENPS